MNHPHCCCLLLVFRAGGAAHSFEVQGYKFDAGPSFNMGIAPQEARSANPLKQVCASR